MEEEKKRRSPGKNEAEKPSFDEKLTDTHTDSANEADEDREALFLNKITVKKKLTKKKNDGTVSSETLFASVPDYFEAEDLYPVEFDLKEESEIEKAAIEALGEAPSLDLMLYDGDEEHPGHESAEESAGFESFLFDYKETMANALSIAKAERKAKESEVSEPIEEAVAEEAKAEEPIEEAIVEEVKAEEPIEEAIAKEVKAEEPIEEIGRAHV